MKSIFHVSFLALLFFAMVFSVGCSCGDDDDDDNDTSADGDDDDNDTADDDDTNDDDDTSDDDDDTTTVPEVTGSSPADNSIEARLATDLVLTFSDAMDTASVESAFSLNDGFKADVSGTFAWNGGNTEMTFTPDQDLEENILYTAALSATAQSAEGLSLAAAYEMTFTTVDLWTIVKDGGDLFWDVAYDVVAGSDGNFYATGLTVNADGYDVWIESFDFAGTVLHTEVYNGPDDNDETGTGIARDESGNIYIVGKQSVTGQQENIWVRKYDSAWDDLWTDTYNNPYNSWENGEGIAVDASQNVYITGTEETETQSLNLFVRKYNSAGTPEWTISYNGPYNLYDQGYDVALDTDGNLYVTGYESVSGELYNVFVRKYDPDGATLWTETYNDPANLMDAGKGIAVDSAGDVVVVGYEGAASQGNNFWVRKYDSDGDAQWTEVYDFSGWDDHANAVAVDSQDNIIVVGFQCNPPEGTGDTDAVVRKYDSEGNLLWHFFYDGGDNRGERLQGVCVDQHDNIIAAGQQDIIDHADDFLIIKLDPDGNWAL